jgi:hypothetical protein
MRYNKDMMGLELKKLFLTFFLIIFSGCAYYIKKVYPLPFYHTLMTIDNSVRIFEETCNVNVTVPIYIGELSNKQKGFTTIGMCIGFNFGKAFRYIVIDKDYAESSSVAELEMTVLHELGHCESGLVHDRSTGFLSKPNSLMFPVSFSTWTYTNDRLNYIKSVCPVTD